MLPADPRVDGGPDRVPVDEAVRVPTLAGRVQVLLGLAHRRVHGPEKGRSCVTERAFIGLELESSCICPIGGIILTNIIE